MQAVKSKNTNPELSIRRLVHAAGFRFRLHRSDLPGCPDLVFPSRHKVIFVHGCFWHGHTCRRGSRVPKTNTEYWLSKVNRNQVRDAHSQAKLKEAGWQVFTVWECEIKAAKAGKVLRFLALPSC